MLQIINLDLFETVALAVVVLFLGMFIKKKIVFLEEYCIPSPVIGGLVIALVNYIFYLCGYAFAFNETIEDLCMVVFFTTIGLQVDLRIIKKSFLTMVILLVFVFALIVLQNIIALGTAFIFRGDMLNAMTAGSISMMGGAGVAEIIGPVLEDFRLKNGQNLAYGMCTLGFITSALIGGPIGRYLIKKHNLKPNLESVKNIRKKNTKNDEKTAELPFSAKLAKVIYRILIIMGLGMVLCDVLSIFGPVLPDYIGAMFIAIIVRNIGDITGKMPVYPVELNYIGALSLSLFLAIDFMNIAIWQLSVINITQIFIFIMQFILITILAFFVIFKITGKDYDAAVITAATCGFGLGASSSAISNMMVLVGKYGPSIKSFLLVPIVGTLFADTINSVVIYFILWLL
ncbi:sodium/glutamate symporter [Succinivibrio dextrinosolvens]|uniref:sodium/glutamate symporter n=1 Tax=Succinivibrio dextrinosolvens TaxID=83771 RepID=UPI0019227CC3|nr:sodium/glutamate symporter [Succinivibrio dextrinosolvens]